MSTKNKNKNTTQMEASKDGVEVAKHLMSAMMYGSSKWWTRSPEIHLVFKNPSKSLLTAHTNFVVTYTGGALKVHDIWTPFSLFSSKSPQAAMDFMAAKAKGYVVSVSVTEQETMFRKGILLGNGFDMFDKGIKFWDIRTETRRMNNASASRKTLATAAVNSLVLRQ